MNSKENTINNTGKTTKLPNKIQPITQFSNSNHQTNKLSKNSKKITFNDFGKTTNLSNNNNIQLRTDLSWNIYVINNFPKNNNESIIDHNINFPVKRNEFNNNVANSINLNNKYSELIDQSTNNVAVLTNYNPSTLYKFSTTNNGNDNSTNKRRNIVLNIRTFTSKLSISGLWFIQAFFWKKVDDILNVEL